MHNVTTQENLQEALNGSYFTILGAGGPLEDWETGINEMLEVEGIGTPIRWYATTGAAVNRFAGAGLADRDYFPEDLTILMFPLEGLHVGKLAMLKLRMGARWFDDIINNMRRS